MSPKRKSEVFIERLESIFAFIDIQGFIVEGKFIPREVSFTSDEVKFVAQIDADLSYFNMSSDDRIINYGIENYLNLPLRPYVINRTVIKLEDLEEKLRNLYYAFCGPKTTSVGVKNIHTARILKKMDLPFVDLDSGLDMPSIKTMGTIMKDFKYTCKAHPTARGHCAGKKGALVWTWIQRKIKGLEMVHDVMHGWDEVDAPRRDTI